jgi:hypothetical protein
LILAPDRVAITLHAPAAVDCVNNPEYPLQRRLAGPQSWPVHCGGGGVCPSLLRSGNISGIPNDTLKKTGITLFKFILLYELLKKLKNDTNAKQVNIYTMLHQKNSKYTTTCVRITHNL